MVTNVFNISSKKQLTTEEVESLARHSMLRDMVRLKDQLQDCGQIEAAMLVEQALDTYHANKLADKLEEIRIEQETAELA